jgi:ribulose-5-phosphate 4-epimerase/fuculose-1-phosphate aldolase
MSAIVPDPADTGSRDLAAAFRLAARFGWHEAVANHFSLALPGEAGRFLINPQGRHWSRMCASDIVAVGGRDPGAVIGTGAGRVDPTAWHIHAAIHARVSAARCILHTHMPHATALACLKGYRLQMIDQNAMRFHERIAYDDDFGGMALDCNEGERLCRMMRGRPILLMANHGVLVTGPSVAAAFDEMYYLERACQVQVLALSTGQPLKVVSEEIAAKTCREWHEYPADIAHDHFEELKRVLDEEEPTYAS